MRWLAAASLFLLLFASAQPKPTDNRPHPTLIGICNPDAVSISICNALFSD